MCKSECNFDRILSATNLSLLHPVLPLLGHVRAHPFFLTNQRGLTCVLPLSLIDSFVLLLCDFPAPDVHQEAMTHGTDSGFIFTKAFFDAFTRMGGLSCRRGLIPRGHLQKPGQF